MDAAFLSGCYLWLLIYLPVSVFQLSTPVQLVDVFQTEHSRDLASWTDAMWRHWAGATWGNGDARCADWSDACTMLVKEEQSTNCTSEWPMVGSVQLKSCNTITFYGFYTQRHELHPAKFWNSCKNCTTYQFNEELLKRLKLAKSIFVKQVVFVVSIVLLNCLRPPLQKRVTSWGVLRLVYMFYSPQQQKRQCFNYALIETCISEWDYTINLTTFFHEEKGT